LLEYVGFTVLATLVVAWRMLRRRYAVVQIHNPPDFLMVAALFPKLLGARIVLDVHDFSRDMFEMRFGDRLLAPATGRALAAIERAATSLADVVLTVHEPYRSELIARGVHAEKVTVVMNSLDERLLPGPVPPSVDRFRVVYHGTLAPHYGVDLLVEAAAIVARDVPRLQLELYGSGDALNPLLERIEELGIGDRVVASGETLPQDEVLRRVAGASVGVVPNRPTPLNRFALSSKLFEYVALGIPAVCANLPTLREHFSTDEVQFFTAGCIDELAESIRHVACDPAAAARRASAARRAYARYRWELQARHYVDVLARLGPVTA
jgi:glycosyltransferase involved in cell wall biosynthesis